VLASAQNLAEKELGARVLRMCKKLLRGADLDDFSLVHEDDAIGDLPRK
jgi:hypothetical protein